jgi:hypothetical protein
MAPAVEIMYVGISPLTHTPHEAEVLGVSRTCAHPIRSGEDPCTDMACKQVGCIVY